MNKIAQDHHNTTEWALAFVNGASFVLSGQYFMLANRETGRAHELLFAGGGLTFGIGKPSFGKELPNNLSYTSFRTSRPVQFSDFDKRGARITEIKTPIFGKSYLIIYDSLNPLGRKLGKISMGGWSLPSWTLTGQAFVNGALSVNFGDGKLNGKIKHVWNPKEDKLPPGPVSPFYQAKPFEDPLIVLPDDVMFGFDSHAIKSTATPILTDTMSMIELGNQRQVTIEGHTDAKGSEGYNLKLSLRRANAVKRWFVEHECEGARNFTTEGFGELRPIADNKMPDGSDNAAGRARNRRVELRLKK